MNLLDIIKRLDSSAPSTLKQKSKADDFRDALFGVISSRHCTKTRPRLALSEDQILYLRCSELYKLVLNPERFKQIATIDELTIAPPANAVGSQLNFDVGHAIHAWWQNEYLSHLTGDFALWGRWACGCGRVVPGSGRRPETFCHDNLSYEEIEVRYDPLRLTGHPDAVLGDDAPQMIGEIKTIGSDAFDKLKEPLQDHQIQVHAYMKATGLNEAIFVYVDKGKQSLWRRLSDGSFELLGEPRVKIFHQHFDEVLWARIESAVVSFWNFVDQLP